MKNMGTIDRIVRVVIALVILALYFAGMLSGTIAIVLLILSGIFIITSLIGTCPLYLVFGIKTHKVEKK